MNIKKNDIVYIRVGRDKGKRAKVLKIDAKNKTALIEGINLFKKNSRPKREGEKGEILSVSRPLAISKIMLYCSSCKKGSRVGRRMEGEAKVRFCTRCKASF